MGRHALGVPLPPFLMAWLPSVDPLAVVSIGVLVGGVLVAPRLLSLPARVFAFAVYGLSVGLGLALNLSRDGVRGWTAVFQTGPGGRHEARNEYLPALGSLTHGVADYVGHFPSLIPYLPVHVRGNPPGPVIALHLLGIDTPGGLFALCVGLGALTAPLAYDLGRTLGGEDRGRVAALLTAFSPALLLFGVTSVDYAFGALALAAACLLARRGGGFRFAGASLVAVGSFFSWLLLAVPVWAALLVLRREGWRAAVALAAACGASVLAVTALLALSLGYDPVATLRATTSVYRHGISATRPYEYWVFGSPVAWALMAGIPTAWLALRALGTRDAAAVAIVGVVVVAAVLGFTKAETERIWIPFVPLACVAAAGLLDARRIRPVLLVLASQALAVEILFDTVW
jgi:hypothetical protein